MSRITMLRAFALALPLLLSACASGPSLTPDVTNAPVGGGANVVPGSSEDFIVNVGRRTFFGEGSAALDDSAQETLTLQAAFLNQHTRYKARIQGHSDEKGSADANRKLSVQRAEAVRNFLVSKGVDAGRISVQGVGNTRPQLRCQDISCWAQNRRVLTQLQ